MLAGVSNYSNRAKPAPVRKISSAAAALPLSDTTTTTTTPPSGAAPPIKKQGGSTRNAARPLSYVAPLQDIPAFRSRKHISSAPPPVTAVTPHNQAPRSSAPQIYMNQSAAYALNVKQKVAARNDVPVKLSGSSPSSQSSSGAVLAARSNSDPNRNDCRKLRGTTPPSLAANLHHQVSAQPSYEQPAPSLKQASILLPDAGAMKSTREASGPQVVKHSPSYPSAINETTPPIHLYMNVEQTSHSTPSLGGAGVLTRKISEGSVRSVADLNGASNPRLLMHSTSVQSSDSSTTDDSAFCPALGPASSMQSLRESDAPLSPKIIATAIPPILMPLHQGTYYTVEL